MTKLIILRGPSGVGKSTVAQALMKRTPRPTVLVDLDHYRFGFVNPPETDHDLEYALSTNDILTSLKLGFDVIFDGNFSADRNDEFLLNLFHVHQDENYLFYLDATLDETLRRHVTKVNPRIDTAKMKEVYQFASPTGLDNEVIIPQDSSVEQTVQRIIHATHMDIKQI